MPVGGDVVTVGPARTGGGARGSSLVAMAAAGPFSEEWGVPVGYVQSKQGAQAAAVGWVGALGPLMMMGPIATGDTLRALMTVASAEPMIEAVRVERDRFVKTFKADPVLGIWVESPLQIDLVEFAPERAVVKVWSQLLMGAATDEVQVLWRTHTVTLLWERGDWRVDAVARVEGPTPAIAATLLPSPGSDFAELARWTPAMVAGSSVRE